MTKEDLIAWETRCGFSNHREAAAALGVQIRTYEGWMAGKRMISVADGLLRQLCPRIEKEKNTPAA